MKKLESFRAEMLLFWCDVAPGAVGSAEDAPFAARVPRCPLVSEPAACASGRREASAAGADC